MKKKYLNLRTGISSGFLLMILLILTVGIVGYIGLERVYNVITLNQSIGLLQHDIDMIQVHTARYQLAVYKENFEDKKSQEQIVVSMLEQSRKAADMLNTAYSLQESGSIKSAGVHLNHFQNLFHEYTISIQKNIQSEEDIQKILERILSKISKGRFWIQDMETACKILISNIKVYFNKKDINPWTKTHESLLNLNNEINSWHEKLKTAVH